MPVLLKPDRKEFASPLRFPLRFGPARSSLYNTWMPNRAYASVWIRDFGESNMLAHFEHFLATVPLSAGPLGFTDLTVRAVDPAETPVEEFDLRGQVMTPADIVELAKEHHSARRRL